MHGAGVNVWLLAVSSGTHNTTGQNAKRLTLCPYVLNETRPLLRPLLTRLIGNEGRH